MGLLAQGVCPQSRRRSLPQLLHNHHHRRPAPDRRGLRRGAPRLELLERAGEARLQYYHRPAPDRRGLRRGAPKLELLERAGEPRLPCACSGSRPRMADSSSSTWV